jgi:hypothetical protein
MRRTTLLLTAGGLAAVALACVLRNASDGANHREAPITALDHRADITDVFAFVSYGPNQGGGQAPEKITLILDVDPLLEPGNGPTLFPFDPGILYEIKIDNDHDAEQDFIFQFRFSTEYQLPNVFTAVAGFGAEGAFEPGTKNLVVPPRVDSFDDIGLNQRQTYTVTLIDCDAEAAIPITAPDGSPFFAVPCNAGARTMDYAALYQLGTYHLAGGMSVFAGTVDDPFWIDLGATFDTANFRTLSSGTPGVLTAAEDQAQANFAADTVSGYAVNAIAIEVPIAMITHTRQVEPATSPAATIGVWGTTSRRRETVRRSPNPELTSGPFRQVQRMGNALINELVIGIGFKDRFSMDKPKNDVQFTSFLVDPPIARIVEALYQGALQIPPAPRLDLLPLVKYLPPIAATGTPEGPIADLLRLNTGVPATPYAAANRLGLIGGDPAGYPNGRRVFDDVTDITLRVAVGGVLVPGFNHAPNAALGDGVNVNDAPYPLEFPYLALCPDGRNRRHVDPGEPGGGPIK